VARGSVRKDCPCATSQGCKLKHGSWYFIVPNPLAEGPRQIKRRGFSTRAEAEAAMRGVLGDLDGGTWRDDRGMTLGEWLEEWLEACTASVRSPKTLGNYRTHCRDLWIPELGHVKLRELRRHQVERALRAFAARPIRHRGRDEAADRYRSAGTLGLYRNTLRAALNAAIRSERLTVNVAEGPMDAIPSRTPTEVEFWTLGQTARFLEHVQTDDWSALWEVAAYAGPRRGELAGMRWEALDADGSGVTVQNSIVQLASRELRPAERVCPYCRDEHKGLLIKPPKSVAGRRWIPLVPQAQAALAAHRFAQDADRQRFGPDYRDHGLAFCRPDGDPIRPAQITTRFHEIAEELGLPPIRLHDVRHGTCALLLAGGVPIEVVSMIMGHSSPAITRRVYAHVLRDVTSAQVAQAARLLDVHRTPQVGAAPPGGTSQHGSTPEGPTS
jgi:integrase